MRAWAGGPGAAGAWALSARDLVGWSHARNHAPRPVDPGRPLRLRLALPPGGGPDGIARALRVELAYSPPGCILDLGCLGPAGFRGWSGGARREFVITPAAATPGYLPGEIEPGTWQVMIGLSGLPARGAEYRVTAEASSTPGRLAPPPPPAAPPPLADGDRPPRRGPARGAGAALAGRRSALAHRALGRRADGARAGAARGGQRARLPRDHRSQHGQPPRRAARRQRPVRDHPAARAGGHHERRARRGTRRHRLGGLPRAARRVARAHRSGGAGCCRSTTRSAAS